MASTELEHVIRTSNCIAVQNELVKLPGLSQEEVDAALSVAIDHASSEIVGLLLDRGAQLDHMAFRGAIIRGDPALFSELINHGWDINTTQFGSPVVKRAIGNLVLLRWLLDHGANPNTRMRIINGSVSRVFTALGAATMIPGTSALDMLLSYGAEIDPMDLFHGISPANHGEVGHIPALKVLIDHGANINYCSRQWGTPLHYAIRRDCRNIVKYLLERGADQTIRSPWGELPAEQAKRQGRMELYRFLRGEEDKTM